MKLWAGNVGVVCTDHRRSVLVNSERVALRSRPESYLSDPDIQRLETLALRTPALVAVAVLLSQALEPVCTPSLA